MQRTKTGLARFREEQRVTLDATARLFGVDRTTILRWEKGRPFIPIKRLDEAVLKTGIPKEELRPDIFGAQKSNEDAR